MTHSVLFSKGLAISLSLSPQSQGERKAWSGFRRNSVQLLTVFTLNVEMWFEVKMTWRHVEKNPSLGGFFCEYPLM